MVAGQPPEDERLRPVDGRGDERHGRDVADLGGCVGVALLGPGHPAAGCHHHFAVVQREGEVQGVLAHQGAVVVGVGHAVVGDRHVVGLDEGPVGEFGEPGVHEVEVGEVDDVLGHPARGGLPAPCPHEEHTPVGVVPVIVGPWLQVGHRLFESHPDRVVLLLHVMGAHPGLAGDDAAGPERGDEAHRAGAVVLPSVVGAHQVSVSDAAGRQSRAPVHALVAQSHEPLGVAVQHDVLAQQAHLLRLGRDFARHGDRMPVVPQCLIQHVVPSG